MLTRAIAVSRAWWIGATIRGQAPGGCNAVRQVWHRGGFAVRVRAGRGGDVRPSRRSDPVQDRHLGPGRDHLSGLDGGGRRLLREGRAQSRSHQHGRRHARPASAAVRRNPRHACGARGALIAGRIDVAPLIEPAITLAKERGFNPIIDLAAAKTPWIFDSVVVTNSYLKGNRATLTRFVKAYLAGAYLALADENKAKEVIAQKFKTNDAKVIAATYADFKRLMPRDAAPSLDGAKNVLAQLEAIGTDIGSRNANEYLDLGIIDTLKQEGYFAQLEKTYPVK